MDVEQILSECAANNDQAEILAKVRSVVETDNMAEIAQMLSSGNWIAIHAILCDPPKFILGKIAG